jgi:Tol biopolymer transport system component
MLSPAWAPDSDRIAWSEALSNRPADSGQRVWVAAPDGSNARPVSKVLAAGVAPGLETVRWLPHGKLAYIVTVSAYVARPRRRPLLVEPNAAAFSADTNGSVLATTYCDYSGHDCVAALRIHDLATGAIHALAGGKVRDELPAVSPDGRSVVFDRTVCADLRCDPGDFRRPSGLWISSTRAGAVPRRIAPLGRCASWSPTGKQIAYIAPPRQPP